MSEVSFELPSEEPAEDQPVDDLGLDTPEVDPVEEPLQTEPSDDDLVASAEESDDDVEEAPQQESRAQKRIRQEIDRRKDIETRLEENQRLVDQQRQQLQDLMQRLAPAETRPEAEPAPDYEEDPAGHLLWQQQQLQKQVEQQRQWAEHQQNQQQAAQQQMAVTQQFESLEAQFRQEHPDYDARVEGLRNARIQMYRGMGKSDQEAQQRVHQEAMSLIMDGFNSREGPVKHIYDMAAPYAAQSAPPQAQQPRRQAPSSLGSRGTARGQYTVSDLANMDSSEFDKITSGDNWEKLLKSLGA